MNLAGVPLLPEQTERKNQLQFFLCRISIAQVDVAQGQAPMKACKIWNTA
jgi:hypothetical protein